MRIVPFRGEYFELKPAYEHLVSGLIYPVPDPTLPFLGVHLTRMIDGGVHAGPNAVLALAREGYSWGTVDRVTSSTTCACPACGGWAGGSGGSGSARSQIAVPQAFPGQPCQLVPALPDDSLRAAPAGVRAQALRRDGSMVDDFAYERGPPPGARAQRAVPSRDRALEIGRPIADEVDRALSGPDAPEGSEVSEWVRLVGGGRAESGDHRQHTHHPERVEQADLLTQNADQRRTDQKGEVADGRHRGHRSGRGPRVVGRSRHADGKAERGTQTPQHDADGRHRDVGPQDHQGEPDHREHGGSAEHRHPTEPVEHLPPNNRPRVIAVTNTPNMAAPPALVRP